MQEEIRAQRVLDVDYDFNGVVGVGFRRYIHGGQGNYGTKQDYTGRDSYCRN